eukprot:gb/GECG01007389.1/.p1 GENE.gb/GECG01007389.1/~~gb/GECG01007389.1/.p1  ORF type:complete len:415 (+),score=74.59 gb/GECG01007389.1/:1-1245(+)
MRRSINTVKTLVQRPVVLLPQRHARPGQPLQSSSSFHTTCRSSQISGITVDSSKNSDRRQQEPSMNPHQETQEQYMEIEQQIATLHDEVRSALHNNDFDNALKKAQLSRNLVQDHFGRKHAVYAACTNNIALAYKERGEFDNAIEHYEEAITLYRDLHGENHESTGAAVANAGLLYRRMAETKSGLERSGLLDTACDYLQRALQIRQSVFHEGSPVVAVTKQHIGGVLRLQRRYKEAEEYMRKALEVLREKPGVEHRAFATVLNSYGLLLKDMERFDDAQEFYQQALDLRKKLFGEDHPETIAVEYNLSELAAAQGDEKTAIAIQSKIAARAGQFEDQEEDSQQEASSSDENQPEAQAPSQQAIHTSNQGHTSESNEPQRKESSARPKTRSDKRKQSGKVFHPGVSLDSSIRGE